MPADFANGRWISVLARWLIEHQRDVEKFLIQAKTLGAFQDRIGEWNRKYPGSTSDAEVKARALLAIMQDAGLVQAFDIQHLVIGATPPRTKGITSQATPTRGPIKPRGAVRTRGDAAGEEDAVLMAKVAELYTPASH